MGEICSRPAPCKFRKVLSKSLQGNLAGKVGRAKEAWGALFDFSGNVNLVLNHIFKVGFWKPSPSSPILLPVQPITAYLAIWANLNSKRLVMYMDILVVTCRRLLGWAGWVKVCPFIYGPRCMNVLKYVNTLEVYMYINVPRTPTPTPEPTKERCM